VLGVAEARVVSVKLPRPITTGRGSLRDFTLDDVFTVVPWLNDRELMKYSKNVDGPRHTFESQHLYWLSFHATPHYYLTILDHEDKIVGTATAYVEDGVGDIGLLVGVSGQGHGLAAFQALTWFLFFDVGVRKVTGGTVAENKAYQRICERTGLKLEGVRPQQITLGGVAHDVMLYGLVNPSPSS
jgi:RimJ/RimL family protein N-acetyltransferase